MANNFTIKAGTNSKRLPIYIQDTTVATGAGVTGLVFNSASLVCNAWRESDGDVNASTITLVTATRGTWTACGFIQKDATNMPGWYEFGVPNAVLAAGACWAKVHFRGAANMADTMLEIELVGYDPADSVRIGLTALPNAAAEAAGGLYTRGIGAGQINQTANGAISIIPAADAIAASSIATGAIAIGKFGTNALAASNIDTGAISIGRLATNAIAASNIDTAAISVGKFGASAIAASVFSGCAITNQIFSLSGASQVWDAAVRTITGTVTVATNNDKTGYVLAASSIAASTFAASSIDANAFGLTAACTIWNPAVRAITANNDKTGYILGASSIAASTFALNAIDTNSFATNAGSKIWDAAVRTITGTVTVGANNDKTGYVLAASSIGASTFEINAIDKNSFATNAGSKVWDAGVRTLTALGASTITVSVFADSAASRVAEVVLTGITLTEVPQGQPTATPTLASAIQALYMAWRNTASTSTGCIMVTNDAGTVVFKASISDSASTFQRSKWVSGP